MAYYSHYPTNLYNILCNKVFFIVQICICNINMTILDTSGSTYMYVYSVVYHRIFWLFWICWLSRKCVCAKHILESYIVCCVFESVFVFIPALWNAYLLHMKSEISSCKNDIVYRKKHYNKMTYLLVISTHQSIGIAKTQKSLYLNRSFQCSYGLQDQMWTYLGGRGWMKSVLMLIVQIYEENSLSYTWL